MIPDPNTFMEPISLREKLMAFTGQRVGGSQEAMFGEYVHKFCADIAYQKRERDCKARIQEDYYNGEQWKVYDSTWPAIREDRSISFVMDAYSRIIDHAAGSILAVDMRSEALAIGDSAEDRISMDVVNAMLDDHHYRNNRSLEDRVAMLSVLNGGDHFMRLRYDENQLATIVLTQEEMAAFEAILERHGHGATKPTHVSKMADGRIRATYPVGGTTEHHLSAHQVLPEAGPSRWEDVTRLAVVEYPSVREARIMYPDKAHLIRPMNLPNVRSGGTNTDWTTGFDSDWTHSDSQTGSRFSELAQRCMIVHYYEKTDGLGWDMCALTGDRLERIVGVKRGMPVLPIVKMSYTPLGTHTIWSNSLGNRIRPLAFSHNAILNQYLKYLSESLKDILLIPDGGAGKATPISNRHRQVVRYPIGARTPPQFLSQNPQTLRIWLEAAQMILSMMWEAGGVGAASRGMAGDRMSGSAIVQQTQNNQTPLQFVREMFGQSIVKRDQIALSMAQSHYSIPRQVTIAGEYSEAGVKIVSSMDITAGTGIRLTKIDAAQESQQSRRDLFVQMFQAGLGTPEAEPVRRAMLHYIATGKNYNIAPPEERQAESQQVDEIGLIMEDKVHLAPPVMDPEGNITKPHRLVVSGTGESLFRPYQVHPIHIRVLIEKLNQPHLTEYHRGLLEVHLQEHQGFIEQEEAIAQQQAIDMEAEQSKARMTGQMATTLVAQQAKDASNAERVPFAPEQGKELAAAAQ